MKNYIDPGIAEEDITNVFGVGTPSDPVVAFIDKHHTVLSEQWNSQGRWRGWCEEKLEPVEYFRRKLKGK